MRQFTHRLDFKLFGDGAAGPHAENVALHVLAGLAGFLLLRRLGLRRAAAWTAAAFPDGVEAALDPATGNHLLLPGAEAVARAVAAAVAERMR